MFYVKVCLLYVFLTIFQVEAHILEKDQSQDTLAESTTPVPIFLEISQSKQSEDNEVVQSTAEKTPMAAEDQFVLRNVPNDIEVFEEKLGPMKEKQEEEQEAEGAEEAQPEAEEPKKEEAEAAAAEPAAESEAAAPAEEGDEAIPEAEAEAKPEDEPEPASEAAVEPEQPKEEEEEEKAVAAEPVADEKPEPELEPAADNEAEKENVQPDVVANPPEGAAENDESEMPNDEPAKEEDKNKMAEDGTTASAPKDTNKNGISCFSCTSNEDSKCPIKATQQISCPKVNAGDAGKHNGCYTLLQADTNITMRGCVDELAEDGLKFCLTNEKLCNLCYTNNCNDKLAPSNAVRLQFTIFSLFFFSISSIIIKKISSFTFTE